MPEEIIISMNNYVEEIITNKKNLKILILEKT
jgi:hypothetical protein